MIIVTWWLINYESPLIILAYDPAAISIPSFGVNDIWSLLFKFAWVVRIFDDVMMTSSSTTKSVSFITWFLWCLFRVTFWIKQAFTKQWSEHHFSVPYHVTQNHVSHDQNCHVMTSSTVFVTWHIMESHDIPIYSILKCSNRTKFTCNFSLYMWGVTNKSATLFLNVLQSYLKPPLLLCEWVSFKSNMTHSWQ